MSIQEIVKILIDSGIPASEANVEVKMMIEHYCQYTALDIIRGVPLDYKKLEIVKEKAKLRAKTKRPIQYIMGVAHFMKNIYKVNENVLIPRGETEELVAKVLDIIKLNNLKTVLDIGTGSGCIACSIAENSECNITAVDISEKALEVAKLNAINLKLDKRIKFIKSNLFENVSGEKFDLIVSNPPYIPIGTKLQEEVTFEPKNALFADDNGLYFYKKIISNASNYLNNFGCLTFEIGYGQGADISKFMKEYNFKNISIEKDLMGVERIISGQYIQN